MTGPSATRPQRVLKGFLLPLVIAMVAALLPLTAPVAVAAGPCDPVVNPIVCENSKAGSPPSEWDIAGAGDAGIQGFSTEISVNAGQPIKFKIDTNASNYTIAIYRTGWYGGNGARKIANVTPSVLRQNQPQCISDLTTELYDCGNWAVSATWQVPSTAVSGIYIALLTRPDNGDQSHITFIVRNDGNHSDVVFQTSDTTWQAYNGYGGSNFYQGAANGRAYKLSYNRPMDTRGGIGGRDFYFANEYPMVRFLEQNGYDVSYISGLDTDRSGAQLLNHKVFLSVGHDEYWSGPQRAAVTAARDAGVNLQFLSGNEMYWRTRFEASTVDGGAGRTLTCYKETWANSKSDPSTQWTGTWRDPRFASQSNGAGLPENGLTGTLYMSNYTDLPVTVSAEEGKTRLWRNTSLTSLPAGSSAALAPHTIGYESNEDLDNGFRPAGLIQLSTTVGNVDQYLQDFGNTVKPGRTTHHLTLYRAPSGALVFSAGSVQWTWGLDQEHDGGGEAADPRMRQAQVNLLADMGAQPATRAAGIVAATASTDRTGPTVSIAAPANAATIAHGASVTVSGTASDSGGVVAGVEVSTDGGTTWHPAQGKQNWTYTYIQKGLSAATVQVRAIDDSANIGAASVRNLTVTGPYSVFGQTVPAIQDSGDAGSYELGLRFSPTVDGFITGVRFYKSQANTGTHIGSLWSGSGERLATATFANETPSGWQQVLFSQAVPVAAGQTYTVSYWTPNGHYASKEFQWAYGGSTDAPLTVAGGFGAQPAGVYSGSGFPIASHNGGNYFVDALFSTVDTTPMTVSGQTPYPSSSSVSVNTKVSAVFSKPVTASSVQLTLTSSSGPVAGTTTYDSATRRATFTPSSALAFSTQYTATLSGTDSIGGSVTAGGTWSFTTAATLPVAGDCPCSLFDDSVTPGIAEIRDGVPLTLGVRFSSIRAGEVTGVRFYKSAGNTGTHNGALYTASGQQLTTVTFANESASGWQTAMFSQPVQIAANTEYIVSYTSLTGTYSATTNGFGSGMSVGPLRASSDAGAYTYSGGFPASRSTASYLVDVIAMIPPPAFTASAQSPLPGASSVPLDSKVSAVLSEAATPSSVTLGVKVTGGAAVAGTTSYDQTTRQVTFTPASPLAAGTSFTATLAATSSTSGQSLTGGTWTFTTVPAPRTPGACPCTLYQDSVTPTTAEVDDGAPLTLGVRFSSDTAGQVTGVRFYKSAGNTGTHTGWLYSGSGQLLASVTFTNESSMGWQTASFSQPVNIAADTEYVVAYKTPTGKYSYTAGGFGEGLTSGPLRTTSDAGAYSYSSDFPNVPSTASYLVDLVLTVPEPPLTVTAQVPSPGATGIPTDVKPSITLSSAIRAGASMTVTANGASVAGSTALSTDGRTVTFTPATALPNSTAVSVSVTNVVSQQGQTLPTTSWQFTTASPTVQQSTIFGALQPQVASASETKAVELGTAFSVSQAGNVTGIRFYKGAGNTGTHVGSLWNAAGTRLAQVTFVNETATGWQTATLSTPVALVTGQTYVVSYRAPNGRYSYTTGFFNQTWTSGVFTASGPNNGLYRYGASGTMPANSWNATNYFVDVVYATTTPPA